MRRFSVYTRGKTFYVRFWDDETKSYTPGMSTRETSEKAAMAAVYHFEKHGKLPGRAGDIEDRVTVHQIIKKLRSADLDPSDAGRIVDVLRDRGFITAVTLAGSVQSEPFIDFLTRFWSWDGSPYVKEKRSRGQAIGRARCYQLSTLVGKYWKPAFPPSVLLSELTRDSIRSFADSLAGYEITNLTRNHILNAGFIALRWAASNGVISSDPSAGLPLYTGDAKKRGILDTDELRALFAIDWPDHRAKLAAQIALVTGARAGEIAALTVDDVGDDALTIRRSYSPKSGLKGTKTGTERRVPIPAWLRDAIRDHTATNPHGSGFIFWTVDADRPIDPRSFRKGFYDALATIHTDAETVRAAKNAFQRASHGKKVDATDADAKKRVDGILSAYRERKIDFHGFRHAYAARLAERVDMRIVQHGTGHTTPTMAAHYANHESAERFRELADASRLAFSFVDPTPVEATN